MPAKKQQPEQESSPVGGNVEKIREIIFGGQMQEYDRRFRQLEERLQKDNKRMRDDVERRISNLEEHVRTELAKLADKDKQERKERLEAVRLLNDDLRQNLSHLREEITELDDRSSQEKAELRDQLHQQGKQLGDTIRSQTEEVSSMLDRESQQLHDEKISRQELSGFLSEIAMRLNREFDLPISDE